MFVLGVAATVLVVAALPVVVLYWLVLAMR
jgi:hypothetical protein